MNFPFLVEIASRYEIQPDPCQLHTLIEIPSAKSKKELKSFLEIMNCLSKYLPATFEISTTEKADIIENGMILEQVIPKAVWQSTEPNQKYI